MAQPPTMKRFYRAVTVGHVDQGFRVLLDGRPVKTQAGRPQIIPSRPLADAMAKEWDAQGEEIDPAAFLFRDLADYAIDMVASDPASVIAGLIPYAETDTLCYRADPEEPLYKRQQERWEPFLARFEAKHGLRFERVSGIVHRPQPAATLAALGALLEAQDDFTLAALNTLTTLAASLIIGLAALEGDADAENLWAIANLEEDWQAELWGQDWMAQERRARRLVVFGAAMRFAVLARVKG